MKVSDQWWREDRAVDPDHLFESIMKTTRVIVILIDDDAFGRSEMRVRGYLKSGVKTQ
jgi:hypothetical protein